jgi:phosphoribosylformylglycinamidine synthase I
MKFGVIVFPGSNCDRDCRNAIEAVGFDAEFIWHRDTSVAGYDCLVLPGGYSYGDYLRPGAIARFSPVMDSVVEYARDGRPVIGICNGFQILLEAGLLPGAMQRNVGTRFICDRVRVRIESTRTPFTLGCREGDVLTLPIAHADGKRRPGTNTGIAKTPKMAMDMITTPKKMKQTRAIASMPR